MDKDVKIQMMENVCFQQVRNLREARLRRPGASLPGRPPLHAALLAQGERRLQEDGAAGAKPETGKTIIYVLHFLAEDFCSC